MLALFTINVAILMKQMLYTIFDIYTDIYRYTYYRYKHVY